MKIAILGGGLTGLTAAYELVKKGHKVKVYEKEDGLGGLARGYKNEGWRWYLEKTIHHLFSNDRDILNFAEEIGFKSIFFQKPETASLYKNPKTEALNPKQIQNSNLFHISNLEFKIYPLDSPMDLLRFPLLGFIDKLRAGMVLAFLKVVPPLSLFEKMTAEEFLIKSMGKRAWKVLWQELFRKKFGKYAGNILASFIWARVKKRTKSLGYVEGGFQNLIDHLEKKLTDNKVEIYKNREIKEIEKRGEGYLVNNEEYDLIISTLPTPILGRITGQVFPQDYLNKLNRIRYLHSVGVVIESEKPIFEKTYWMNIIVPEIPLMGLFQQTNFIDKKYYGGKHILYCGWYVEEQNKLWSMSGNQIINYILPYLKRISNSEFRVSSFRHFKAMYAQPIFEKDFLENKPSFLTPLKNFYIANLDMTYPYDRGTNFAVKLGKEVAGLI